jgi:hypothetical protein
MLQSSGKLANQSHLQYTTILKEYADFKNDRDLKFDLDLDQYSQEELSKLLEKPIKKIHCEMVPYGQTTKCISAK